MEEREMGPLRTGVVLELFVDRDEVRIAMYCNLRVGTMILAGTVANSDPGRLTIMSIHFCIYTEVVVVYSTIKLLSTFPLSLSETITRSL